MQFVIMIRVFFSIFVFFVISDAQGQSTTSVFDIARKGSLTEIEELFKLNARAINEVNANGFTPLILACYSGNNNVAQFLIRKGCDINYKSPMGNALMAAVVRGNLEMVTYLLTQKANIDETDDNGVTALMFAIQFTNVELVQLLLKNKADKTIVDKNGKTAFEYAVSSGNEEIINLLK